MSWVNGAHDQLVARWTYSLLPRRAGTFTIGSAEVDFDGSVYSTDPIQVEVVEGEAPRAAVASLRRGSRPVSRRGP